MEPPPVEVVRTGLRVCGRTPTIACVGRPARRHTLIVETRTPWGQDLAAAARWLSAAVVGGLIAGAVVGGLGGRVAMLVLRLTSDDVLHGLESDDGFVMGQVSAATLFLVIATCVLGVLGALFYVVVRGWLPGRRRPVLMGVFGGIVGGSAIVQPDGIDFRLLEPLPLAIVFFVGLPAAYGVVMSRLVERRLAAREDAAGSRWWVLGIAPLLPIAFLGPVGLAVVVLIPAVWYAHRASPALVALWGSPIVTWIGRLALLAVLAASFVALARDVSEIL